MSEVKENMITHEQAANYIVALKCADATYKKYLELRINGTVIEECERAVSQIDALENKQEFEAIYDVTICNIIGIDPCSDVKDKEAKAQEFMAENCDLVGTDDDPISQLSVGEFMIFDEFVKCLEEGGIMLKNEIDKYIELTSIIKNKIEHL